MARCRHFSRLEHLEYLHCRLRGGTTPIASFAIKQWLLEPTIPGEIIPLFPSDLTRRCGSWVCVNRGEGLFLKRLASWHRPSRSGHVERLPWEVPDLAWLKLSICMSPWGSLQFSSHFTHGRLLIKVVIPKVGRPYIIQLMSLDALNPTSPPSLTHAASTRCMNLYGHRFLLS